MYLRMMDYENGMWIKLAQIYTEWVALTFGQLLPWGRVDLRSL